MEKSSILIVEDNNIVMMELKDRLIEMGYNVVDTASSGEEAIKKAGKHLPDLIMMDIRIKGEMDGIDSAAIIRKEFGIPVVYLTAHTDENTVQRAKVTEPYGYIIKPFEERELSTTIEMALYKHSMERKLRESEHWLMATLKSIGDALIATDFNGTIKLINKIGEDITGYHKGEALGKKIGEVFIVKDPVTGKLLENPVDNSLRDSAIIGETDKIIIAKDGIETPIDFSSAPINFGYEPLAGVVLVFRNITERIRTKEIIEKQKVFLKTIIDTDPNYISVKNRDGRYELTNKATADAFGTTTEEMYGKYDVEYYGAAEADIYRTSDREVIDTLKEIFIPEDKLIDSKGKVHLLQTFKRAIDSRNGDEKLVLSVGSDITSLKQTEEELKESKNRISTLLKAIPDTVLRFSRDGVLLDCHVHDAKEIFPNLTESTGEKISNIFDEDLSEKIIQHSEKAFTTSRIQILEYNYKGKPDTIHFEIRIINNSQDEFVVILKDITEMKKTQLELQDLNSSKDKFFSIIAHDLKSPFVSLLGFADFLEAESDKLTKEELKTISESIKKSSKSIFNLLENLLQWSRIQAGKIDFEPDTIRLKEIADRSVVLYSEFAERKNISIIVQLPVEFEVFADANMVETIFRNLISNAIKFTNSQGSILINATDDGDYIETNIIDDGVGIREAVMSKLFRIDENISTNGTHNEKGSGLGLVLCKEFVEINGGKLKVNSKPGKGTTFSFSLKKKK